MDTAIARPELLLVADAVAREKNIDREEVLEAMEQAIQKAGRAKYGHEKDIDVYKRQVRPSDHDPNKAPATCRWSHGSR